MTHQYKYKNLALMAVFSGLMLGCSQSDDNTSAEVKPVETQAEHVGPGEVNVYSARKEALIKPMLDQFEQQTGITVNLVTGKADTMIERLRAEGESSPADVLITVDAGRLYRAQSAGLTQAVVSEVLNAAVPSHLREPEGHWFGLSLRARPIMYAKDRVDPNTLSTYEDLASDTWAGKVCIRSSSNIYNQSLVASMVASSDVASVEQWATNFVPNFARNPVGGDRDQIKALAAGECDVAVANTYYLVGMLQSDDESERQAAEQVAVFWPNQADRGTHVNVSGIAMTQHAPNAEQAQQLMEFLVAEEAQSWYAEKNGEYPVRTGVATSPLLVSWGEFKQDDLNIADLGKHNADAVMLMDRAGWQ